jgi:hypothetical protein
MTHENAVELIEQALRSEPSCAVCPSHTIVTATGSGMWLECAASRRKRSRPGPVGALGGLRFHTRRHLVDADAIEPAA